MNLATALASAAAMICAPFQRLGVLAKRTFGWRLIAMLVLMTVGVQPVHAQESCLAWLWAGNDWHGYNVYGDSSAACGTLWTNNGEHQWQVGTPSMGTTTYPASRFSIGYCDIHGEEISNFCPGGPGTWCTFYSFRPTTPMGVVPATPAPTCSFWVMAVKPPDCQTCSANKVTQDPIDPTTATVYKREEDGASAPGMMSFQRFYSSGPMAEGVLQDMGSNWTHSYSRSIYPLYQTARPAQYPGQSSYVSPSYSDPGSACTQGFAAIQSAVNGWQGASASWNGSTCILSTAAGTIGTLIVYSASPGDVASSPLAYDLIRDDGQVVRYSGGTATGLQPGTMLQFAVTGSGYTVKDENDNTETYNAAGVLQTITSRTGVIQTMSYDSNGFLSGVTDSFGHTLSFTRDVANEIATATFNGGATVQYGYDSAYGVPHYLGSTS